MRIHYGSLQQIINEALLNAYRVLGVPENASEDEIKLTWRKLALQNHPDRGGSHGKMVDINNAKSRLLDKVALFRYGPTYKSYEGDGYDASTAHPTGQSHTTTAPQPQMITCSVCGRSVSIKDNKIVGHYTVQGGNVKCGNSFKHPSANTSTRGTSQPPPPRPEPRSWNHGPGEWRDSQARKGYEYNSHTGKYRPKAKQQPAPDGDWKQYKVYPYQGHRRVVRVKTKLYGTGLGGRLSGNQGQTKFNSHEKAYVKSDGNRMKVKKTDSDHTQTWDPIDEVTNFVDRIVVDVLAEIVQR